MTTACRKRFESPDLTAAGARIRRAPAGSWRVTTAILAGSLAALFAWALPSEAGSVDVEEELVNVRGVSVSFGIEVAYVPESFWIGPNNTTALLFAPGPLPITMEVDIIALLHSANVSLSSSLTNFVNTTASALGIDDPWNVSIPINDTPLGNVTVASIPVFESSLVTVYLDVVLTTQLNGSLNASAGSLNLSKLLWYQWGGKEVGFMAPNASAQSNVTARFNYSLSAAFVVRFETFSILSPPSATYTVASFQLADAPFNQTVVITAETIDLAAIYRELSDTQANLELTKRELANRTLELQAALAQLTNVSDDLNATSALLNTTLAQLEGQMSLVANLTEDLNATRALLNVTFTQLEEQLSLVANLTADLTALNTLLNVTLVQLDEQREMAIGLAAELNATRAALNATTAELEKQRSLVASLSGELNAALARLAGEEATNAELTEALLGLQAALNVTEEALGAMQNRAAALEAALNASLANATLIAAQLEAAAGDKLALEEEVGVLTAARVREQERVATLTLELNDAQTRLSAANASLGEAQRDVQTTQSAAAGATAILAVGAVAAAGAGIAIGWTAGRRRRQ